MFSIDHKAVPEDSLLKTYRGPYPERWGRYGDCFSVAIDRDVTLADFAFAFYTSSAFRPERWMLRALLGVPSSDAGARALADGSAASFAVWYVGERTATQLLMCDRYERTRSWFRVAPLEAGRTLLHFGSAVAGVPDGGGGAARSRGVFRLLMGFHVVYSQVLLHAAKAALRKAHWTRS